MLDEQADLILQSILDNISTKVEFQSQIYYILIKKQRNGNHCLFFITDFSQNLWVKKITPQFICQLKKQLKIKTQLKAFTQHFAVGIKQHCNIWKIKPIPVLVTKIKIGDGLVISCALNFQYNVNISQNPSKFSSILKVFGRQLFEAKQIEHKQSLSKIENLKAINKEMTPKIVNKDKQLQLANSLFAKPEAKIIPQKHRDLINPFRKKRRGKGMKIRRQNSSDSQES